MDILRKGDKMGVHNIPDKDTSGNQVLTLSPFASKKIGLKSIFKRAHGVQRDCVIGQNIIEFVVPYAETKMNQIEIINGENLDFCDLEIYDTPEGKYSGHPNIKLNQFGYSINVAKDYYNQKSEFDADIYGGMKFVFKYTSISAKRIAINIILNELKL